MAKSQADHCLVCGNYRETLKQAVVSSVIVDVWILAKNIRCYRSLQMTCRSRSTDPSRIRIDKCLMGEGRAMQMISVCV
jgi:hypothetical protein